MIIRIMFAVLMMVVIGCSRQLDPARTQAETTTSTVHYDNVPSPTLPDEVQLGALAEATPAQLKSAIDRFGAALVIELLWGHESEQGWRHVEDGIASGEQAWLDLVPALRSRADGAAAEGLDITVSRALLHNPRGVLRLVDTRHPVSEVCAMNEIEPTEAEVSTYLRGARQAVEAVRDPDLQDVKAQCLDSLRHDRHLTDLRPPQ